MSQGGSAFPLPFVVWVNDFDEKIGGNIVLHRLAFMLQQQGHEVYLANAHATDMPKGVLRALTARALFLGRFVSRWNRARVRGRPRPTLLSAFRQRVTCHPSMPVPTMRGLAGRRFVAVYPQGTASNPLGATHVVRWLLHRPGFMKKLVAFSEGELTFFYQPGFVIDWTGIDPDNLLRVRWLRDDIYRNEGLADRHGTCRMVRKGAATFVPGMETGDRFGILDNLPHPEIAAAFNRCDLFVCHDPHTMYLYYAALCGCTPVVVPQPGLDAATWRAGFELKQGVAYGMEELDFARETREGLLRDMARAQAEEDAIVARFAQKVRERFLP